MRRPRPETHRRLGNGKGQETENRWFDRELFLPTQAVCSPLVILWLVAHSCLGCIYSLIHPVVLDVSMEGNLITDVDIDGVALHAVLLLFLLFRAEAEVRGPTPLPGCIAVGRWLFVEGPSQQPVSPALLHRELPLLKAAFLVIIVDGWRGGERGRCEQNVAQPQHPEQEAGLCQHAQFARATPPHDGKPPPRASGCPTGHKALENGKTRRVKQKTWASRSFFFKMSET